MHILGYRRKLGATLSRANRMLTIEILRRAIEREAQLDSSAVVGPTAEEASSDTKILDTVERFWQVTKI